MGFMSKYSIDLKVGYSGSNVSRLEMIAQFLEKGLFSALDCDKLS